MTEEGKLPGEYPFAEYVSLRDREIIEDRLHPKEIEEENVKLRERMEAIHKR